MIESGRERGSKPQLPLRRVRKSYEQVADQLRELIVSGSIPQGGRLPTETVLARDFGVSRATVRESLRLLAAQGLIRTAKGQTGGSYVTLPTVDHISESLGSSITLLADARDLTLEELIEVRELLEVPAARLAARRRAEGDVERLRATIPPDRPVLDTQAEFVHNRDFHAALIECCENRLLQIAAQPVFSASANEPLSLGAPPRLPSLDPRAPRAESSTPSRRVTRTPPALEMRDHLAFLVPYYEKAWKAARLPAASGR